MQWLGNRGGEVSLANRDSPPSPETTGVPVFNDGSRPARPPGAGRWAGPCRVALLAASDGIALLFAGTAAFLLWAQPIRSQDAALYVEVTPAITLILVGYGLAGLYPGFGLGPVEVLRRYFLVTTVTFLVLAALVFGLKLEDQYSRVTLAIAFVLSLLFIGGLRWAVTRGVRRFAWWPEPAVLVSDGRRTELIRSLLTESSGREFQLAAVLDAEEVAGGGGDDESALAREGEASSSPLDAMPLADAGVEVAFADVSGPGSEAALDRLRLQFPRVIVLREFEELPVEGVQVRNLGGVLGLEYGNNLLRRQSRVAKRSLELVVAFGGFVLTLPLMLAAMLAVKLLSPGPALFRQSREGRKGRTIQVPKIRTMVSDAEERMDALLEEDPGLREEWEGGFKLQADPRVIPVLGRLLRRFSIDELPQLWSVLRGDMSLVGPRPFPAYHLDALSDKARRLRAEVRPGVTGLWQVAARGEADVEAQEAYDLYYIRNWSIWLDLYILMRTFSAVVRGKGAW